MARRKWAQLSVLPWQQATEAAAGTWCPSECVRGALLQAALPRNGGGGSPCNFAMIHLPPGASNPAHPALCTHLRVSRPTRDHCPQQGHFYGVPSLPAASLGSSRLPDQPDALPEDLKCPSENSQSGAASPEMRGQCQAPPSQCLRREVPCRLPLPAPCPPLPPAPGC